LGILTTGNKNSSRVEAMALNNIKFSACQNTMRGFKKRTGHFPTLTDGVDKTPAGVVRILAALRGGIKTVIIPNDNERELSEVPEKIKGKLNVIKVKWIDEVLDIAQ
jgi:hypothetical protein